MKFYQNSLSGVSQILFIMLFCVAELFGAIPTDSSESKLSKQIRIPSAKNPYFVVAGAGYGVGLNKDVYTSFLINTSGSILNRTLDYYSLGEGTYGSLGFGYFVNDNLSFRVGFQYQKSTIINWNITNSNGKNCGNGAISGTCISIIPAVYITIPGISEDIIPYLGVGALISVPTVKVSAVRVQHDSPLFPNEAFVIEKTDWNYPSELMFGTQFTLGTELVLNKKAVIAPEILFQWAAYIPNSKTLTGYWVNGVDEITTVSSKNITLTEHIASNNTNEAPKESYSYCSLILRLNLIITL
ncbi:MAG: hypothetical protein LWX56_14790 [Ignavibacteria bacterium]|nr:hypothetical protein [Ignavibacteria bacterium]